jgi:hypothetical protein
MTHVERVGLAVGLLLAAALMWPLRGYLTDDTFIHLQYARHLAEGQGLVFNRGERVYGCTSPLWVTLLADGMALGLNGLAVARALGMLATLASVALFLQLMRRTLQSPELRALATVAWAGHAWMLRWSTSGMETSLAVALTLAGFVAFTEGRQFGSRPIRTGALWGLAALTRPEAVFLLLLWCVALIVDAHNRDGIRRLVFGLLPPALVYGLWLMFARLYFGTSWPQTLSAKTAGPDSMVEKLANLWRQARIVGATDGVLVAVLLLALVLGGRRMWRKPRLAQEALPWLWVTALPALYVARGVAVLSRYLLILLPVLGWLAWGAAERWWMGREPTPQRSRRAVAAGVVVCVLVLAQNLTVYRTVVVPQVNSFSGGLQQSLVRWGRWFGRYTPPDCTIATPDIGAIGYYSRRRVLDLAGLVTPRMVPLLERESHEEVLANLRFASFSRPLFLVDRAQRPYDLLQRSPHAACLTPIGTATVPNLGIARPGEVIYTFYRVDWPKYEETAASR